MKFIQILSLAALLLLGATATPVGNPDPSPTERPKSLPKDSIPAGAPIFGLDESPEPDTSVGPVRMTKRDDCNGSGLCGSTSGGSCTAASNAFNDGSWYCGYTSRVSAHCTAIFTCETYRGVCWAGWFLKQS